MFLVWLVLSLVWWGVVLGAAVQAGRAWGVLSGVGALLGCWMLSWLWVIGGLLGLGAACVIGWRAEEALSGRRLTGPS